MIAVLDDHQRAAGLRIDDARMRNAQRIDRAIADLKDNAERIAELARAEPPGLPTLRRNSPSDVKTSMRWLPASAT